MHQRPPGEPGRIVAQIARRKVVRAVDQQIILGEQGDGVVRRDAAGVEPQPHVRVQGGEPARGRFDLGRADRRGVVEDLPLQVVLGDPVEVGQAERAHAGGGEVKRRRAAESAGADHEHARGGQPALTTDPDLVEQDVPAVPAEFGGRELGQGIGHVGDGV